MNPWIHEPDIKVGYYKNRKYFILRNHMGALCGYVNVSKKSACDISCHGGLTFNGKFSYSHLKKQHDLDDKSYKSFFKSTYWLGFDCAHYNDIIPKMIHMDFRKDNVYRDIHFVENECKKIIDQILVFPIKKYYMDIPYNSLTDEILKVLKVAIYDKDFTYGQYYIGTDDERDLLTIKMYI